MTLPNHVGAYRVEFETFDRAIDDPTGIRIYYGKATGAAKKFLARLHQARTLDRQNARRLYPKDDKRYGLSEYDNFVCNIREDTEGDNWVYIERHSLDPDRIESLTEEPTNAPT